jgi:hypothetical protein
MVKFDFRWLASESFYPEAQVACHGADADEVEKRKWWKIPGPYQGLYSDKWEAFVG